MEKIWVCWPYNDLFNTWLREIWKNALVSEEKKSEKLAGLIDWAVNYLGMGEGTKPGLPVMSDGMVCHNLRKQELMGSPNLFYKVLAMLTTKHHT